VDLPIRIIPFVQVINKSKRFFFFFYSNTYYSILLFYEHANDTRIIKFDRFKPSVAKPLIQQVLNQRLKNALYDKDQAPGWAHEISQEIKQKLLGKNTII
jgi:hypothetical protein